MSIDRKVPMRISSQLSDGQGRAVDRLTKGLPIDIVPLQRGLPKTLPEGTSALFVLPFHKAGNPHCNLLDGSPFELNRVQPVSAGVDGDDPITDLPNG